MIVTHQPCGTQWAHADRRSHCTVCHRTFSGHTVGDAHRAGARCLTDDEMTERKFVLREKESQGAIWSEWGGQGMPEDVKAHYRAQAEAEAERGVQR